MATFKYILTDERKKIMMDRYDSEVWTITALAQIFNVPRYTIKTWAKKLGLAQERRVWTEDEENYLRKHISNQTLDEIKMMLHRSTSSIWNKCNELGLTHAPHNTGYSLVELAEGLGCSWRLVHRWMHNNWITVQKQGPDARRWNVSDNAIRKFLRKHPEEVPEEAMKSLWVRDLLGELNNFQREM